MHILLADDDAIARRGIRGLLDEAGLSAKAEATDGLTAVRLCEELEPDVLILDTGIPKLNWIEVACRVRNRGQSPAIVLLGTYSDESYVMRAFAAGVLGYLLKRTADDHLIPALRAVTAGKPYFSPAVASVLVKDYVRRLQTGTPDDSYDLLTSRETEVLRLLARGCSNKAAAVELGVGLSTVETHRSNFMQKLNLHNTAEIVLYAVRKGLVQ